MHYLENIFFVSVSFFLFSCLLIHKVLKFGEVKFIIFFFYCSCFGVISKYSWSKTRSWRFIHMLSSKSFMTLAVIFRLLFHFVQIFCILHETGIQLHSQSYGSTVVLATAAEEILLSLFNGFVTPVKKNQLSIDVRLYIWTVNFIPLVFMLFYTILFMVTLSYKC